MGCILLLPGLKISRNGSRLINDRCEWTLRENRMAQRYCPGSGTSNQGMGEEFVGGAQAYNRTVIDAWQMGDRCVTGEQQ